MPLSEQQILIMKQKREKILQEAIVLFSRLGYEGTTIKKVAAASGVSFGTVFTYFENKDQLFHAAIVEPLEEYRSELLDFNPNETDVFVELEKMVTNHIKIFSELSEYLSLIVHIIGQHHRFETTFKEIDQFYNEFREKLVELITSGQDAGILFEQEPIHVATAYFSLLMGIRLNTPDGADDQFWVNIIPIAIQLFGLKRS
ncbi:TetR/AcrR family transcriptional regulator [Bacillus solimangrovi]|uniref:Transcriptional regulator n=1 Tax=Bacillus solimangrovi TaxID=1305675 RepID=A0A1E5LJV3_9BACI|nr:TetR/AcrR family transcriptional regulator [Bacillus solimangrovi]OEH94355.1 transcriptional regulator [Bacillus solimangrovi]